MARVAASARTTLYTLYSPDSGTRTAALSLPARTVKRISSMPSISSAVTAISGVGRSKSPRGQR